MMKFPLLMFGLLLLLAGCASGEAGSPAAVAATAIPSGAGESGQTVTGAVLPEPTSSSSTSPSSGRPEIVSLPEQKPASIAPASNENGPEDAFSGLITISDVEKLLQNPKESDGGLLRLQGDGRQGRSGPG